MATLLALRSSALDLEETCRVRLDAIPERDRPSGRNLVHYLALRQHDLRELQGELAARGLSSLGRAEAHVLATIDAVLRHLGSDPRPAAGAPTRTSSRELLHRHTIEALGPVPPTDRVRLMVTMPGSAAGDGALIAELIDAGMDMARINCAHDDPATWEALAVAVRTAAANARHPVQIAFDLAGPKLRTGPLPPGPRVVRLRPRRRR